MNRTSECANVRRQVVVQGEGSIEPAVADHLRSCPECALYSREARRVRMSLRTLPQRMPPARLGLALRILASKERVRQTQRVSLRARCREIRLRSRLWCDNLAKPFALPATGGLLSTLLLFCLLLPSFALHLNPEQDVPLSFYTGATVKNSLPIGFGTDDISVELIVDEQGRMIEYSLEKPGRPLEMRLRRNIENYLLFTEFTPATAFGHPTPGKVRLTFRRSHIEVKG